MAITTALKNGRKEEELTRIKGEGTLKKTNVKEKLEKDGKRKI